MDYDDKKRIEWVDHAKGICIILVVMMHTTLGIEKATSNLTWLHPFIEWARPFRMPDFFLISGLFLSARINRPWREYVDGKVLHFAYFYLLWMSIQMLTKAYGIYHDQGATAVLATYALGLIEPFGTLWFIYILAVFFVVTKATRNVSPVLIFAIAALLEIAPIETGWSLIDESAARYVYFFTGYWLAQFVFNFASAMAARSVVQLFAGLIVWGLCNYVTVHLGWATLPVASLLLGFIGAGAVITAGVVLSKTNLAGLMRYCGQNSIVIYLSFFVFMAAGRSAALNLAPRLDPGVAALAVTGFAVLGPLMLFWLTRGTMLSFLFQRPAWAKLAKPGKRWHSGGHVKSLNVEAR